VSDKNLLQLNGKTLLERAINSAISSESFEEIIVSTDSGAYADLAIRAGAQVPFLRSPDLSNDKARTVDVLIDFFTRYSVYDPLRTRIFLLQPTSPFRTAKHINDCVDLIEEGETHQSLISITDVGGTHPWRMQEFDGRSCSSYEGFEEQDFTPRQDLPPTFIRNGAIYTSILNSILVNKTLVEGSPLGYEMNTIDSINIDSIEDYWLAERIVQLGIRD
jgi:CMP-N,N'-diacetyllegionaminic acid synthase